MRAPAPLVSAPALRRSVAAATIFGFTAAAVSLPVVPARAQDAPTVLHAFTGGAADGANPVGGLILGPDGAFYGTTAFGGATRNGTVFRLAADGTFSVLYAFGGGLGGGEPTAALVLGTDGNFYGTTQFGGAYGEGTLFRLTPAGVQTVLVDFGGGNGSGQQPVSSLVQGPDGSLYGTAQFGGYYSYGTVFQYTATGSFNVLYAFGGSDGAQPVSALTFGQDGNLYGTTEYGGTFNNGTIFQITTTGSLTVLHSFQGNDGVAPQGALLLVPVYTTATDGDDSGGVFYGTASEGGANGYGTVFEIESGGTFTKLHDFTGADGNYSQAALILASDNNFYGTTFNGGTLQGNGTIFQLTPSGVFTSLADLNLATGENPAAPLLQGADGALYGTAYHAGNTGQNDGTVFRLDVGAPAPGGAQTTTTFFTGQTLLGNGVYYLAFPNGNYFGYYSYLSDPNYIYHFDLGYEYVIDANDGLDGVYFYDFASSTFFYTSPTFPFPYLYDFTLNTVLYYFPNPDLAGHYTTNPRYFYDFATGQIITK